MQMSEDYPGPGADLFGNVRALNTAFVRATSDLKGPQQGRLCRAPFLLFSLREHDHAWWDAALDDNRQFDLVDAIPDPEVGILQLQIAAVSFLWHLARRNPYAVRIISGAPVSWCERITVVPLIVLLERIGARGDLLQSRLQQGDAIADRLLETGVSSQLPVQRYSQLTALQDLLTRSKAENYRRIPAAACSLSGPLRVLDKKV